MINYCLFKIKKETPKTREDYTVQELILYRYQELPRLEYEGDVQRVNAVHQLRSDPYKMGVRRILRTKLRFVQDEIFICIKGTE